MSDAVMVPREELADFADVMGNLIREVSDPGTGALAAHYRLSAMLAASPSVGGWEDISTAPRDLVVQMYEPHSQGGFMFAGCIGIDGSYRDNLRGDALNPTHWMPLPPPPSVSTGSRPQEAVPAGDAETVALLCRQARYVLRDLHAKHPDCGYGKMADGCEQAANLVLSATPQPAEGSSSNEGAGA